MAPQVAHCVEHKILPLAQHRSVPAPGEGAATACFFKAPLTGGTHDFHAQLRGLLEWADGLR